MLKFPRLGTIDEVDFSHPSLFFAEQDYIIAQPDSDSTPLVFQVREGESIILGRADTDSEPLCDVNLTILDALKQGVSRQHLKIVHDVYSWVIVDLNSTNGTRLNSVPIVSNHNYPIQSGDKVCLGNLTLRLFFVSKVES
jgi:pSer/pThr/pTyr-binding forkhead associated (FHA) protein